MQFFRNFIDNELSFLQKLDHTQLQWKFEAVPINAQYYPHGVKSSYRYYANNEVVKIEKRPKTQCRSRLGSLTGLEPMFIKVVWQPEVDLADGRELDGTYLLRNIPGYNFEF